MNRLDHTAIAVHDLGEAVDRYIRLLGFELRDRVTVPEQRVEVAFLVSGGTQIELIQPTDSDSGVARFLLKRGEGLHHIGIRVEDIVAEIERAVAEGFEMIDYVPRRGAHGPIAFVHPRSTGGVLIELVADARAPTPRGS